MARLPLSFIGRVKGGPARGGLGREMRFYTDDTLAVAKQLFQRAAGVGTQPLVIVPNAGIPRALAADRLVGDAFVTVAVGQTASFNVGDLVPIYNVAQGTVYRVITAITPATGRLDLDSALGIAFTVANGTMVNATDMEGHVWGWADDATDTWLQVTELGSNRVLAPVKIAAAAVLATLAFQEEGVVVNSRPAVNFIGKSVTAADDPANNRVNVTIGIAGTEALPAPEVIGDTDTGFFGDGANIISVTAGGKRVAQFVGGTTNVNFAQIQANVTGGNVVYGAAGGDGAIGVDVYTKGTGSSFRVLGGGARVGFNVTDVASAVNSAQVLPSIAGSGITIQPVGSDTSVEVWIKGKGTFGVTVAQNFTDYLWLLGGTGAVIETAVGGSTNIDFHLRPKGSGSVVLGSNLTDFVAVVGGTGTATVSGSGGSAAVSINVVPKGTGTFQYRGVEVETIGVRVYRTKTADETVNNSAVMQNDDHLSFAIGANERWAFAMILYVNMKGVSQWKWQFTGPAGVAGRGGWDVAQLGALTNADNLFAAQIAGVGFTNLTLVPVRISGFIYNGATAGTINFQWAQNSAVAENTQVVQGSSLTAWRVT